MPRKSKTEQEQGYARSAWEERLDLEDEFKGIVGVFVHPEARIGVWKVRLTFTKMLGGAEDPLSKCAIAYVWPNAHEESFIGALWGNLIKLRALIEEAAGLIQQRAQ